MYKYIYGPVYSWRLGSSLGVDLLSQGEKICSFDCTYCQVGVSSLYTVERKVYVPTSEVIREIKTLPEVKIDYVTFSGRGEPTLAENLGEAIQEIKKIRPEPVAVLTNSSIIYRDDVKRDLSLADFVICKIDAAEDKTFAVINRQASGITFVNVLEGIRKFRDMYRGRLGLQIMFVKENMKEAKGISEIAKGIKPDVVQINTPLRPTAKGALNKKEILDIKDDFRGFKVVTVYDDAAKTKAVKSMDEEDVSKRRGKPFVKGDGNNG